MGIIPKEIFEFSAFPQLERYYNEDSNYGVYNFYTEKELPYSKEYVPQIGMDTFVSDKVYMSTLAGGMQRLYLGSEYKVRAELEYNKKYSSWQFRPVVILAVSPKTESQQRAFLYSILTKQQTDSLMKAYPNIVEDVINNKDHVDVHRVKYIGEKTWRRIRESIISNYVISDVLVMLQPLGVTYKMIRKLVDSEPNPEMLKSKLLDNPYIMTKIRGLGFARVDDLAMKINPDVRVSSKRTYAFVKWYLNEIGEGDGHTWAYESNLKSEARKYIPECMEIFEQMIAHEREAGILLHIEDTKIGLKKYYELEKNTYDILKWLDSMGKGLEISDSDFELGISKAENTQGFKYTEEQRKVIRNTISSPVSITAGKAGTGKTSISRGIINIFKQASMSISCCALSAKAAQRIIEATGHRATTIHRLLGMGANGRFLHDSQNPLSADVIFVDEASMINVQLFNSLLQAVKPGAHVVICGDDQQLPPIGAGNFFSDILTKTNEFNINLLTEVLRQAKESGILNDANMIRDGENPISEPSTKVIHGKDGDMSYMFRESSESIMQIAIKAFMRAAEHDGLDNVVIVTPRKKDCINSSALLNRAISEILFQGQDPKNGVIFGEKVYMTGMKVMQLVNNYDKNVFNGEVGYIESIKRDPDDHKKKIINVRYKMNGDNKLISYSQGELNDIDLAYAMTCHKCQGSGYKNVIVTIDNSHYVMLDSCLLYTALTRAKKRCLLVASPQAFLKCVNTNRSNTRQTWLSEMDTSDDQTSGEESNQE